MTVPRFRPSFRRLSLVLSCGVVLSPAFPAFGQGNPVPAEFASPHFAAVTKHLETGGQFFSYVDVDGDFKKLAEAGDKLLAVARKHGAEKIPAGLKASTIIDGLGFNSIKALGLSSRTLPGGMFHNRTLVYTPEGQAGIFKLIGDKPAPFAAPGFIPAGADLLMENDFTFSSLTETIENILKSTGDERLLMQFRAALGFPVPGLPMTIRDFVEKLDFKAILALQLVADKNLKVPGSEKEFPAFKAVLTLDALDFLFEPLLGFASATDKVVVEKGEGFELIRPNDSLPGDLDYFRPVIYRDLKSKRIFIASHLDYVKECLAAAKPLSGDSAFTGALSGLPKEGSGLSYATPHLVKVMLEFSKTLQSGKPEEADLMNEILNILQEMSPLPATAAASVRLNAPEGLLVQSNTVDSHKSTLAQLAVVPVALAAGATQGYRQQMEKAEEQREEKAESEEDGDLPSDDPAASSKTIRSNLQQIAFSAQSWFIDNPSAREVDYEKLVSGELLFELEPVDGESYKGLKITRKGGTLSVKTKDGESISLNYPPVTD